jgi:transglutaminase-like putative cysteine protease
MRLRIFHETAYRYATPASRVVQNLRLTPRGHDGQFVANWRIDVDRDCRIDVATDPFGNTLHSFAVEGRLDSLTITAGGEVETQDLGGVLHGQVEPLPPDVFLRETGLTAAGPAIREFAETIAAAAGHDQIRFLHALMLGVRQHLRFDVDATDTRTSAVEAFAHGHGVCQDFAHVFCAAARHVDVPARYVTGYLYRAEHPEQAAGHAWAEAFVRDFGWIGFDPVNDICPTDTHVRLSVGLDHLGASPARGARYGGSDETLAVRVQITRVGRGGR